MTGVSLLAWLCMARAGAVRELDVGFEAGMTGIWLLAGRSARGVLTKPGDP